VLICVFFVFFWRRLRGFFRRQTAARRASPFSSPFFPSPFPASLSLFLSLSLCSVPSNSHPGFSISQCFPSQTRKADECRTRERQRGSKKKGEKLIASTLDALDGGTRESSRTKRKRDFAYPGSCRKSARTRSSSVSSLEFCSGQSDSGTPARVLPSSVSTVSVLEEELAAAAPPLTPMTVPLSHRPGFFREEGTAGPPSEAEPVPSATQTADPTWHAEPWASAEASALSGEDSRILLVFLFFRL